LEAVDEVMRRQVEPAEIARVTIGVTPSSLHLCGKYTTPDASFVEAQFSIPYVIATLILDGEITVDSFSPDRVSRQEIHRFAREVIEVEARWSKDDDVDLAAAAVIVEMRSGKHEESTVLTPRGSPGNPLTEADLRTKFISLTHNSLGLEGANRLLTQIQNFGTNEGDDVRTLWASTRRSPDE
jgi:2-methylcitrate dehydratase PrpD